MRRCMPLLLSCLLLPACAGDRGEPIETPVTASFAADAADIVEVTVRHDLPVQEAELRGPDGQVYTAHQIERDRLVEEERGFFPSLGLGLGVSGGSSTRIGTSVGIGLPLGGFDSGGDSQVISHARIRIEDMAAYRAGWRDWTLRIQLGTPEAGPPRLMEVPAPRPPIG